MEKSGIKVVHAYLLSVVLTGAIADTTKAKSASKDCEIINLRNINETINTTFDESLEFRFFAQGENWNLSAVITDASNEETICNLVLSRSGNSRNEGIKCQEKESSSVVSSDVNYTKFITGIWTDMLIDTDTCGPNPKYTRCKSRVKIVFQQLLTVETYRPKWIETPLQPPLKIQWVESAQADLVLNCKSNECLVNSSVLVASRHDRWNSFFLKPEDGFQGFNISLEPKEVMSQYVDMENFSHGDSWINVTLDREEMLLKVLIDGEEVTNFTSENFTELSIKSVELKGKGLLTWCEPKGTVFTLEMIYRIVIGALATTVIALFIALVVVCNKPRPSQPPALELATYNPATPRRPIIPSSASPPGFLPRVQQEGVFETENGELIYESINDIMEQDNHDDGHDSDNSLYGEAIR